MRTLLTLVLVLAVGVVGYNYWNGAPLLSDPRAARPDAVGTAGKVDVNAARERGAAVGEKVAVAAAKFRDNAQEAALTSKIKAKMVLDDAIKARSIDVTTEGTTVTVSGVVLVGRRARPRAAARARNRRRHSGRRSAEGGEVDRPARRQAANRLELLGSSSAKRRRDRQRSGCSETRNCST